MSATVRLKCASGLVECAQLVAEGVRRVGPSKAVTDEGGSTPKGSISPSDSVMYVSPDVGIDFGTSHIAVAGPNASLSSLGNRSDLMAELLFSLDARPIVTGSGVTFRTMGDRAQIPAAAKRVNDLLWKLGDPSRESKSDAFIPASELAAAAFSEVQRRVSKLYGEPIRRAVVAVSPNLESDRRIALWEAAMSAGVETVQLISSPVACARSWSLRARFTGGLIVVDIGAGVIDIAAVLCGSDGISEVSLFPAIGRGVFGSRLDDTLRHIVKQRLRNGGAKLAGRNNSELDDSIEEAKLRLLGGAPRATIWINQDDRATPSRVDIDDSALETSREAFVSDYRRILRRAPGSFLKLRLITGRASQVAGISEHDATTPRQLDGQVFEPTGELAAIGAAIEALTMSDDRVLRSEDVLSMPISLHIGHRDYGTLIPAGTKLPAAASVVFESPHRSYRRWSVQLRQGAGSRVSDSRPRRILERTIDDQERFAVQPEVRALVSQGGIASVHLHEGGPHLRFEMGKRSGGPGAKAGATAVTNSALAIHSMNSR